jgi:hypothetical protein
VSAAKEKVGQKQTKTIKRILEERRLLLAMEEKKEPEKSRHMIGLTCLSL